MYLHLKGKSVVDNRNGTFSVEIEDPRSLTAEENKVIETLFPHLAKNVFEILNKEALLAAIAKPSEVEKTPPGEKPGKKYRSEIE